jgi:hypothetical protein
VCACVCVCLCVCAACMCVLPVRPPLVTGPGEARLYVALGTTTADGTAYVRKACDAPMVGFDLDALWSAPAPTAREIQMPAA